MRVAPRIVLATAAFLAGTAPAYGAITLTFPLTTDQETAPVVPTLSGTSTPRPTPFGTATIVINDAMTSLTYALSVFNIDLTGSQTTDINDNLLAAHFHAGASIPASGNLPVVFGFFGTPFNDTTPNDVVVSPLINGVGGSISGKWDAGEGNNTTLTAQLPNIFAGRAYVNLHTVQFPPGEIRGNIPAVPEARTWAMMLLGLGSIGYALRKARRGRTALTYGGFSAA